MKKRITVLGMLLISCALLGGCSSKESDVSTSAALETEAAAEDAESTADAESEEETEEVKKAELPDGVYQAEFNTDNSMFRVTEAYDDKGILTVENGEMTIHVSLNSKNIVNLYPGLAEDAKKDGAVLLEPTIDSVTYRDGWTDDVYGFDIPVPYLNEEFDVALIGKKGKWYDHKVSVSNPEPYEPDGASAAEPAELADGVYTTELTFEGGSGKAEILSPAQITVADGNVTATVEWSSPNYDYMIVDGETYMPVNTDGNSVFEIPVSGFDVPMDIIGDTVAMSPPHEVEYTITFHSDSIENAE